MFLEASVRYKEVELRVEASGLVVSAYRGGSDSRRAIRTRGIGQLRVCLSIMYEVLGWVPNICSLRLALNWQSVHTHNPSTREVEPQRWDV